MSWYSIMGLVASVALFLPIAFTIYCRLGIYKSFPALLAYYTPVFIYNLMTEGYINAGENMEHSVGLFNNIIDAPLMLWFLSYFSTSRLFSKRLMIYTGIYILFEIIVLTIRGFNTDAITIILGPGVLSVFALSIYLFYRFSKIAILHKKATGKAIILAALVFGYGVYGIIYLLYYVFKTPEVANTFLIYFLGSTIMSLTLCTGIVFEKKRIRKLLEMKVVRRELTDIYKHEKRTVPVRTVPMLDFDRELWN